MADVKGLGYGPDNYTCGCLSVAFVLLAPRDRGGGAFIHRESEKAYSHKPDQPIYATSCMSIRPTLQAAASTSDGSVDLTGSEGKTPLAKGVRRPP